jgi:hypothetical protein
MGRTWVLHTETKGTGAEMVPLERVTKRPATVDPVFVPREARRAPKPPAPERRSPRRFRIVDVMTREAVIDGVGAREAVDALKGIRSIVDANVYVWEEELDRWRLLSLAEQRAMWELSRSSGSA